MPFWSHCIQASSVWPARTFFFQPIISISWPFTVVHIILYETGPDRYSAGTPPNPPWTACWKFLNMAGGVSNKEEQSALQYGTLWIGGWKSHHRAQLFCTGDNDTQYETIICIKKWHMTITMLASIELWQQCRHGSLLSTLFLILSMVFTVPHQSHPPSTEASPESTGTTAQQPPCFQRQPHSPGCYPPLL